MKRGFESLKLLAIGIGLGCSSDPSRPERPSEPGNAGSAGAAQNAVSIVPDTSGWVERNEIGIQGAWYPYGDRYGKAKCLTVGLHQPAECSLIVEPVPPPEGTTFPNQGGVLCTRGETAVILPCPPGLTTSGCPGDDFSNMWGAGIGFDFNADKGPPDGDGAKHAWNPDAHGIVGVSFEIDEIPGPKLRVEFPQVLTEEEARAVMLEPGATTDDHPDGAPYWGADKDFPPSPVQPSPAVNVIRWEQVKKPGTSPSYQVDRSRMLGIQLHVPAVSSAPRGSYGFCVKNLRLLRE
ncbi:MAG TPA: hypothetical protein VGK73_36715 [Polyangiaceae bacterium]